MSAVISKLEDYESLPFDIVLFLGVLYHTESPLHALRKVYQLTGEQLILETHGLHVPGNEDQPLWEFFGSDQVNNDPTTWWAPNERGLQDMLHSVGYSRVQIKAGADQIPKDRRDKKQFVRIWAHAWKEARSD